MTEQDPFLVVSSLRPVLVPHLAGRSRQKVSSVVLSFFSVIRFQRWLVRYEVCTHTRRPLQSRPSCEAVGVFWVSCLRLHLDLGSSLDVAQSLIQPMICLFTQGRHKEIKGVLEGERVLGRNLAAIYGLMKPIGNQLCTGLKFLLVSSSHSPTLHVPHCFLVYFSQSSFCLLLYHPHPSSSSLSHLCFLLRPHQNALYWLLAPPPLFKAIPDVAV